MDQKTLDAFLAAVPKRIYRFNYKFQQQADGRYVKRRCTKSYEDLAALRQFTTENIAQRQAKRARDLARYHATKQANSDCSIQNSDSTI